MGPVFQYVRTVTVLFMIMFTCSHGRSAEHQSQRNKSTNTKTIQRDLDRIENHMPHNRICTCVPSVNCEYFLHHIVDKIRAKIN